MAAEMATNNSNEIDNNQSHLLALPVELLQRVTDNLSDETLTAFRLTCKTIEAATFDQFAKVFFEERYCFIYEKQRWTLSNSVISSRIAVKVRKVVFTSNILAPAGREQLQLAPRQNQYTNYGYDDLYLEQEYAEELMTDAVGPKTQIPA